MIAALALAAFLPLTADDLAGAAEGTWLEYEVRSRAGPPVYVRLSALDATAGGRRVEVWISARPGSATQVLQALVVGAEVRRLLLRLGSGPVQEVPPERLPRIGAESACSGRGCRAATRGWPAMRERALGALRTRAGTFNAVERSVHVRGARARLAVTGMLPLGGVLRLETDGVRAELVGTGQGARPAIPADAPVVAIGGAAP